MAKVEERINTLDGKMESMTSALERIENLLSRPGEESGKALSCARRTRSILAGASPFESTCESGIRDRRLGEIFASVLRTATDALLLNRCWIGCVRPSLLSTWVLESHIPNFAHSLLRLMWGGWAVSQTVCSYTACDKRWVLPALVFS